MEQDSFFPMHTQHANIPLRYESLQVNGKTISINSLRLSTPITQSCNNNFDRTDKWLGFGNKNASTLLNLTN